MVNANGLRQKCREFGCQPSWYHEGRRCHLKVKQMQRVVQRCELAKKAKKEHSCAVGSRPSPPDNIHMFWSDKAALLDDRFRPCDESMFRGIDLVGVWSAVNVGLVVHLWSYHKIANVFRHSRLVHRSASDLLPLDEAREFLRRGLIIQHLADLVRMLAAQDHGKTHSCGSWIGDVDHIWIRPCRTCPSRTGHVFATMHARVNTHRGVQGDTKYWKTAFVRVPDERIDFCNSPLAVPAKSEVLDSSLSEFRALLAEKKDLSSLNYRAVILLVLDRIRACGLLLDCVDPWVFHPMPHFAPACHFLGSGNATHVDGVKLPTVGEVLSSSSVMCQTWTTWVKGDIMRMVVKENSLYSRIYQYLKLPSIVGMQLAKVSTLSLPTLPDIVGHPAQAQPQARPFARSADSSQWPIAKALKTKTRLRFRASTVVLHQFSERISTCLKWIDWAPVVASHRRATALEHVERVKFTFGIERALRLRCAFVRDHLPLHSAILVWGSTLRQWRRISVSSGFDRVIRGLDGELLVDCLLSNGRAIDPCYLSNSDDALRRALRSQHNQQSFDFVCVQLLTLM